MEFGETILFHNTLTKCYKIAALVALLRSGISSIRYFPLSVIKTIVLNQVLLPKYYIDIVQVIRQVLSIWQVLITI
jgi:hypothetical protein